MRAATITLFVPNMLTAKLSEAAVAEEFEEMVAEDTKLMI